MLHLLNFLYRNDGSVAFVFVAKLIVFEIHMVNGLVLLNTLILKNVACIEHYDIARYLLIH